MDVVTTPHSTIGVRDLKATLSRVLDEVAGGAEVVVTDRGRPVARLVPVETTLVRLADLVASGAVQAPLRAERQRPARRIRSAGPASDLVVEQRR
jgi:prevent-host-death family protein